MHFWVDISNRLSMELKYCFILPGVLYFPCYKTNKILKSCEWVDNQMDYKTKSNALVILFFVHESPSLPQVELCHALDTSCSKMGFVIWTKKIIPLWLSSPIIHTNYAVILCSVYYYYKVFQEFLKDCFCQKVCTCKHFGTIYVTKICSWKHPQRWFNPVIPNIFSTGTKV